MIGARVPHRPARMLNMSACCFPVHVVVPPAPAHDLAEWQSFAGHRKHYRASLHLKKKKKEIFYIPSSEI